MLLRCEDEVTQIFGSLGFFVCFDVSGYVVISPANLTYFSS